MLSILAFVHITEIIILISIDYKENPLVPLLSK